MEFWTNDTTANAQHGTSVRNFPVTKCEFTTGISYADASEGMKKMMAEGHFDSILVMGNLTVKDLRMLGVGWR
uniref:Uncharacterized protein n=1 Tax=Clandestinovirus TaxID=2831644 RepID=A0A8F8PJU5_9VIRU|nr:hypothetical protein KOM_12_53 [Clandestinovirus]